MWVVNSAFSSPCLHACLSTRRSHMPRVHDAKHKCTLELFCVHDAWCTKQKWIRGCCSGCWSVSQDILCFVLHGLFCVFTLSPLVVSCFLCLGSFAASCTSRVRIQEACIILAQVDATLRVEACIRARDILASCTLEQVIGCS